MELMQRRMREVNFKYTKRSNEFSLVTELLLSLVLSLLQSAEAVVP